MSYSILEARGEDIFDTNEAIKRKDYLTLFLKAQDAQEQGDVEHAETLKELAMKFQTEKEDADDFAYDRHVDNNL